LHFCNLEVNAEFLTQIDTLVQLLESPIFTYLRLQLLDTDRNYYLLKALYGLLMLLPQSSAFTLLRNRLECVPNVHILPSNKQSGVHIGKEEYELRKAVKKIDFKELLAHFQHIQHKHVVARKTKSSHREKLHRDAR